MKLDSESVYHHTDPSHDSDPKPEVILHNDNPFILTKDNYFMIDMLDVDNETPKEGKHGFTSPAERKSSEFADLPKYYLNMEEDPLNKNDSESMEALYSVPTSGFGIVVKEDFYSDKIVLKSKELQDVRVCIEDDPCQIVKDISIDGVQSSESSLVKVKEMDQKESYVSIQSLDDLHNDSANGIIENPEDAASVVCNDSNGKRSSLSLIEIGDKIDKAEPMASNLSADITGYPEDAASIILNDFDGKRDSVGSVESGGKRDMIESAESIVSSSEEINTHPLQVDSSSLIFVDDQKQFVGKQNVQGLSEESICASSALSLPSEVSDSSNGSKEIPANCKVPNDVITFKFDDRAVSTSGKEEIEKSTDDLHSKVVSLNGSETEEKAIVDDARASSRSFFHLLHGESNFHGPSVLSGPVANSGHIPYSGSISFRSTSSTTSARSFVFPILQSEWNSSPVKMAKADQRHLRKHRGWRMGGLLCCRF